MNRFLRVNQRGADSDRGLSLIELIFALVLSTIIGGVIVAALITSLNVANATTDQVGDSTDAGLIAAFLTRDAQSAGATDPTTAMRDGSVGVSTSDWGGCVQSPPFALVVRFSWIEHTSSSVASKVVVTYAFDLGTTQLVRRLCRDSATPVDVVLASGVVKVEATCKVVTDCTGTPVSVSLDVVGSGTRAPFSYTVTASLRGDTQDPPTLVNSTPVPLLVLGGDACPNLELAGTGVVTVIGNALVDETCGSSPIAGDQALLQTAGTNTISRIVDPFLDREPPNSAACAGGGMNPVTIGLSPDANTTVVYPQAVNLTDDTTFEPGQFVFCNGLQITDGRVTGTDVLLYIAAGSFDIATDDTVDLTGRTTADANLNMLVWVAMENQTVTIAGGPGVDTFRGLIYAPKSTLDLSSLVAVNIGGINVQGITFAGAGRARIGLPLPPALVVTPSALPAGQIGQMYTANLAASGGTGPYTWSATGLPAAGFSMSSTGVISGTPGAPGDTAFTVTVFDEGTSVATSVDYIISVPAPLAPALTTTVASLAYIENTTTALDNAITVADVDSANLSSATVTMTTAYVNGQDTLAFVDQNGITGTWTPASGTLALSGSATLADYQAALQSITYTNNSNIPDTTMRTVTFVVNDGGLNSNTASRTITLTAVNDAPVNSVPGNQTTRKNQPKVFSSGNGNLISISDADAAGATVRVQLVSTNGEVTLSGIGGLTFSAGDGSDDVTMTFTGTIANVNSRLAGLSFDPINSFTGTASLQITTSDLGNTGTGGTRTDTDTIAITVT